MNGILTITQLLKNAASCCEKHLSVALEGMDVSPCQALVLMEIAGDAMTMSGLSRILHCHKSNITQIIEALVAKGLIERTMSTEDRRVARLQLTSKGARALKEARMAMGKMTAKCLSIFSVSEKRQLKKLLQRYVESHA